MKCPTTRWLAAAGLFAVAGSLGCSTTTPGGAPPATPVPARSLEAHPGDVHFLTGMIHHHGQALVMSALVPDRASNPSLSVLAERITVSQTDEIALMQQWLRERGEEAPDPSPGGMTMMHGGMEHEMLMPGMLSEEQLAELENASGSEFDRLFLTYMIMHHEGALGMVEDLFATPGAANDDFIYKMASDTFADQGSEIDRMQQMLEAMGGGGPD